MPQMTPDQNAILQGMIQKIAVAIDQLFRTQKLTIDEELAFVDALHAIDHLASVLAKKPTDESKE